MLPPAIVFFLSSEWARYHRPGLLRAVARASEGRARVLVVDNPVCLATSRWHRPERWRRWREHGELRQRLRTVSDNLVLLDSAVALHDRLACTVPGMAWINRRMLSAQVRWALRELQVAPPLVSWFQFPTFHHYPGMLGEALALYECYDEHADVPGLSSAARRRLVGWERRLMRRCGLVFTTSKPLFDARRPHHPNVALTYNGADLDFFAPVGRDSLHRVAQRRAQPPTVGYLGTVHQHTDLALLAQAARQRPDWRFVLVGPVQPGADEASLALLRSAGNVELHGWVAEEELAALLCRFDVGAIPYRSDARFNHFVNPNKLHEYTAMGKPVVASPGLDLSSHAGTVAVADGADRFVAAIEAEHAANSEDKVRERLRLAALNSWDARARTMLEHIERTLHARAGAGAPVWQPAGRRP
jgi:glycosyltransferase involved in cell wall biosynthesis